MKITKKFGLVAVLTLISFTLLKGQSTYNSPYSRFGLGDLYHPVNAANGAMGGLKYGIRSNFMVNPSNPASYTAFNQYNFVFDAGLQGSVVRMSTDNKTRDDGHFNLGSLMFGLPINKKFSAALGLLPYSSVGYAISDPSVDDEFGGYNTIFEGEGGINKVLGGLAFKFTDNLSAGINVNYLFGSLNFLQTVTFDSTNFLNIRSERSRIFSDVLFEAGLQYEYLLNKEREISLVAGLYSALPAGLNLREDFIVQTFRYSGSGSILYKDTVHYARGEKGEVNIPWHFGGGLSLRRSVRWMAGADFSMQNWSKYEAFGIKDSLSNSYQIAVGGQYKADFFLLRAGLRFNKTYLQIRNNQLNEYGISFGVGIPVYNKAYSVSLLSLGVEIGQRGTTEQDLIKESFGRIWLNFTMNQERWFKRREYL